MIGKASEIKTKHVSTTFDRFGEHLENHLSNLANAEILDIKFSTSFDPGSGERVHALIIYKQD